MAKIILPPGIASISGTMGPIMYKTFTRPDGTKETRVYQNPYYKPRRLRSGDTRPRSIIWAEVKAALSDSANV